MPLDHRSNNFDLIRLAAATQVVLLHAVEQTGLRETLPEWQRHAFGLMAWLPGVPIFFVISGFLIARSYERCGGNLAEYFWNRSLRIFPALWVCLGVTLILLGSFGFLPVSFLKSGTFVGWLLGQLSFLQFFNPDQFRGFGIGVANGALWTITVELQFYLFVPLLYAAVYRLRTWKKVTGLLLLFLFLASYAAYCVMNVKVNGPGGFSRAPFAFKLLYNTLWPHLWMFMVGIFIHRYFELLRSFLEGKFFYYIGAYLLLATVIGYLAPEFSVLFYLLLLPARILLGFATISGAYSAKSLSRRLLCGTDLSYGIYIYHSLVINVLVEIGLLKTLDALPIVFIITAVLGLLSWHLIEKPVLARKAIS